MSGLMGTERGRKSAWREFREIGFFGAIAGLALVGVLDSLGQVQEYNPNLSKAGAYALGASLGAVSSVLLFWYGPRGERLLTLIAKSTRTHK